MASAEVRPTKMASTKAANMASAKPSAMTAPATASEVASTKAANMASAKPSAVTAPEAATSKVASTASDVAAPTSSSTMLAKRHRATRHRESTDGDARQQRDDGAA